MMRPLALVLCALTGCGASVGAPAKVWTAREFVASTTKKVTFGGLPPARLAVLPGQPIPWRSTPFAAQDVLQGAGRGLPLWPAFAEGKTATVLFTEIWDHHPVPWLQPVYAMVTDGVARGDLRTVFGVNVDSTFYTPFWRARAVSVPAETGPTDVTSATRILNAKYPQAASAVIVCPIVPDDVAVALADGETTLSRPLSGEPVPPVAVREAWVDGVVVRYLGLGPNKQSATANELPDESPVYFFMKSAGAGGQVLSLPPVLPESPLRHSLLRRYEVTLSPSFGVFVHGDRPALKTLLEGEGAVVPPVDPAIDEATGAPFLLRVATNPACFLDAATFPASCKWLDSQSKLEAAIAPDVRVRTEALLTGATLQVGP